MDWGSLIQWLLGEGLPYFIIIIVVLASLFVFVFITSLFPIMRQIIAFAYLNSLISVIGRKIVSKDFLESLYDSKDIIGVIQYLRSIGISVEPSEDIEKIEESIVRDFVSKIKIVEKHVPKLIEPYFKAYKKLITYEELIKIIRALSAGLKPDLSMLYILDPKLADAISDVSAYEGLRVALSSEGISLPENPIEGERELFLRAIRALDDSLRLVDESVAAPVREFILHYKDYYNMLIIIRGILLGLKSEYIESLTLGEGMYFSKRTLHKLSEATSINEVIAELQGTPYEEELRTISTSREHIDVSLIEASLSRAFLRIVEILEHKYSLGAGPLIRYLVSLSFGLRNIRLAIYGVAEKLPKERLLMLSVYG